MVIRLQLESHWEETKYTNPKDSKMVWNEISKHACHVHKISVIFKFLVNACSFYI